MNTSHRSLWNSALGAWVAVSEITRARGKRGGGRVALAGGGLLALGLLLAPGTGFAQNYGSTGGAANGGAAGADAGPSLGGVPATGLAGTLASPNGGNGAGGDHAGGGGYSNTATGDISAPLQGGNGGNGFDFLGGGGGAGDGVRITAAAPVAISAAVTGGRGGNGAGAGGGGAGVVLIGNNSLATTAQITGGNGGNGTVRTGNAGGGGGAGVILQGASQLTASAGITGGNGGVGVVAEREGNGGAGVLLVGAGSVTTTATGAIAGGAGSGIGGGGAGVALLSGGTIVNAGTIRGGNGGGNSTAGVNVNKGGTGSGGASGYVAYTAQTGSAGAGITGAGINITNSGAIAGGTAAGAQANAITFTGGSNSLTLQTGSVLTGAIGINAGATASIVAGNTGLAVGALILGGNATVDTNGNSLAISGAISGAGNLAKTGAGTLTLSGTNSYSGGTTVSAGTLLGNSASLQGAITNNAAVTFDQTADGSYAGVMSGSGSLTKTGTGTLTLTGVNVYGGGTTLSAGGLMLGNNSALGSGALTVTGASTLGSTTAVTVNNNVVLNAGLTVDTSNDMSLAGTISGAGGLTKTGTAVLTLAGINTYAGGTTVNGGTLRLGAGSTLATGSSAAVATGATLDLNGNNQALSALTGTGNVALGSATLTLTVDITALNTFGGNISGTGGVTKAGRGALWLDGTNTYSGATTIDNSFLVARTTGSLSAASAVTVNTQGTLILTAANTIGSLAGLGGVVLNADLTAGGDNTSTTFGGVIGSFGRLTKTGTGTLTLTGNNAYTGGTTVAGGTLQGDTTSLKNAITNNAMVVFNQAANGTYAGNMDGTGSLTKTNNGTLILTGRNSYSGGTSLNLGTLQGNSDSLQGAIHNGTAVVFDQAANGSYGGVMDGPGSLTKTGAGTLTLTGANVYSGGTTVTAGTLQGDATSLQGNVTNNAAVNFNQAATGTYAGVISGSGTFTKTGAGKLILTGASSYSGATRINSGTLSVNGSIANSAVTVNNGGTLGGSGTAGATTITTGGVLAPGNSIGTLSVKGNLTFAAGSLYRVEVDGSGASDRVNATGAAALNGTVDLQAGAGSYAAETSYSILRADGGISGRFAGVTSSLAFLTPSLSYNANSVLLNLARNEISFSAVASTPNQFAVATALQNTGVTGDMETVQRALLGMSAAQARAAYDAASGMGIATLLRAPAGFAAGFGNQLQARLGAQAAAASGFANSFTGRPVLLAANDHLSDLMAPISDSAPQKFSLAGGASSLSSSADTATQGLWVRGYGGYGDTHADGNAAASRLRSSGLSIGFDTQVGEGLRLGAAVTSGSARLSTDNNESGKTRSSAVAVYAGYAEGPWNFSGSASLGWGKSHMDRNIAFGALNRVASSDFDSNTLFAYGEATYSVAMDGWTLQPLAGLALSRSKADGFTETGAGALNLQVAGQTVNSSKSMLGAKASIDVGRVRFEPRMVWAHEFGDLNTPMTAQFQGATTASPFQALGTALKRDTLVIGLGATGSIAKGVDLFADVQAEHNSAQRNLAVLVGLRSRW